MARTTSRYQKIVRDTAAVLAAANRIYPAGWLIIESDTAEPNNMKEADGITAYNSLAYGQAGGGGGGSTPDASTTVKGLVKLSVAPAAAGNPIAVGTNDSRMSDSRTPTAHSHAQSDITGLVTDLSNKQPTLVSGTNIKTINGSSILGTGDITISGGSGSVDTQSNLTYAATTNIDMNHTDDIRILALTGNVTFTTSNRAAALSKTLIISADSTTRSFTWPTGWIWLDQVAPSSLAASKTAVLSLYSKGTAETDIIASYSAQL